LLSYLNDAESGIINSLHKRYAVISSITREATHADPTTSKNDVVSNNITTITAANSSLLEYFLAEHGEKIFVAGAALPAIMSHTGEVLRPAVLSGGNFVAVENVSGVEVPHPEKGQIGWKFDKDGCLSLWFVATVNVGILLEEVKMRVWVAKVERMVEGI
jgi:hypothetical protein